MSAEDEDSRKRCPLSRRHLLTFDLSEEILTKLRSKGFTLKSEIECLSDETLKSICDLNDEQMETINKVVKNSHKRQMVCKNLSQVLETKEIIHTGSYSLDKTLDGGVHVSRITQISSEGGAGKTQICMQCCVNVQLPPKYGGLSGRALYIDTEDNFRAQRVVSMARHRLKAHPDLDSLKVEEMNSNIFIYKCVTDSKDLVDLIVNRVEPFIEKHPGIRLIVVDSIAQHFRYDYKGSDAQKDYELCLIAQKLRVIAHSHRIAILIANQVQYNPELAKNVPALGKHWHSNINTSIYFEKLLPNELIVKMREGSVLRSNQVVSGLKFFFEIEENGIKECVGGSTWHPNY